ncbi:hypothetical protein BVC80_8939g13 [Macleaya cordata]|uniref:Uncharacterized protein n=1 Tax=Macleaya cordata TaxID=56857 RepID=A0A200R879_MACCD|nr:hypothetical protein BVC80_8939g13 [Macleaya cordata]
MPGNEVADKVHNFFEQDNLSEGQHQPQVARGNWPFLNNNQWVGNRRPIESHISSNLKNFNILQSDSEIGNGSHSSRMQPGPDLTQLTSRPEFTRGQSRNQQLSLNGFMHGQQGLQTRQNPTEFLGEDALSDAHNLASRGLSFLEPQQGNTPELSPALSRTSERSEVADSPVNFNFLGGQQQLMRGQQPGMSQSRPRQQMGLNDMQSLQQQFMFKQLQELQRQQQLDQEARGLNSMNQLSTITKQAAGDQLQSPGNGTHIHDASNFFWPTEHMGGDPRMPSTSQMFMVGNVNWVQHGGSSAVQRYPSGLNSSHDQGQASRSMGFPQQLDQSLYGTPVGSMRSTLNQYSHLQGISQDFADMLTKASSNQLEKPIMQSSNFSNSFQGDQSSAFRDPIGMQDGTSVSKQGFQGKNLFGQNHFEGVNTGVQLGNFQQVNSLPRNASVQEFHGRQQQAGWLQEKASNQGGPSQGSVSLDPTEEKILFSSDDNSWGATVGGSSILTGGYGNPLENGELFSAFPSIQNGGTMTALMQSALAEGSGSGTGLQDEWSSLSFHKTDMSTGNQAATVVDSPKEQKDWADKNLPSASSLTSRPFPLFDDANMNPSGHCLPGSQQPRTKFSGEQSERIQPNASHEYIEQPPKEALKWLNSSEQKPHVQGNHLVQPPIHLENASGGAWPGQIYEQSESSAPSRDMGLNAHNMDDSWVHRQNLSSYKIDSQPCNRSNGWNTDELLSANGNASLKMHENDNTMRQVQTNDLKMGMHMEMDCDSGMWKAGHNHAATSFSKLSDGSGTGSHHVNRESSHMSNSPAGPNSNFAKANQETHRRVHNSHHLEYGKHVVDSSVKPKGDDAMAKYQHQVNKKEISIESYNSSQSHHNATGGMRANSWLNPSDSRSFGSGNQKSMGQVGRKASGSRKFQYHPMGDLTVNVEPADTRKHVTHSQSLSQQVIDGSRSLEQGYLGYPKFIGQIPNNSTHVEEGELPKIQENVKGSAELPSRGMHHDSTVSSSFDGSAGFYAQNKSHMLELLHKVDQSRENSSVTLFRSSDRIPLSRMPEAEASDASVAPLQRDQSASSQGFGLRLAPPTQRLPVPNHAFSSQKSSQTVNDLNSKHVGSEVGEKSQTWLNPSSSVQPLHPREIPHGEHWDNKSSISGEAGNEPSQSKKSAALFTGSSSYQRDQMQHQQVSGASGDIKTDRPVTSDRLASQFRQTRDTHNGLVADQSAQTSLPGTTSRNPPFNLSHPVDTSQLMGTNSSYPRVSGQHLPVLESFPVSQPSATSGMSRQGTFSTMSHNVWTSVPAPQYVGSPAQSINLSNRNMERTSLVQKQDDQSIKRVGNGPEFGTCSINSQRSAYGEDQIGKERSLQQVPCEKVHLDPETSGASQGQESSGSGNHTPNANSITSDSLAAHPHHHVLDRRRYGKDPVLVPQTEHVRLQNQTTSNRDFEAFGHSLKQAHASHQNYSLLQQVRDMKGAETDPDTRVWKRFKGSYSGPDTQQIAAKTGQQLFDGNNTIVRDVADNEVNAAALQKSLLSGDGRMVRFSSEAREDLTANSSQLVPGDLLSQDTSAFGRKDSKDCSSHLNMMSARSENPQISPQMAPSWFEQYGTFKNGKMLPMYNSSRTAENTFQRLFSGKSSESLHANTSIERVNVADAGPVGNVCQSTDTTLIANEHISPPRSLPSEVTDQSLSVIRPKKRKTEKLELLPWHKEVMRASQRLLNISMAEQDWAQAANRLVEKVEDEVEMVEDGQPVLRPRRRLILTTQLMQQLLRPPPPAVLSADATSYYETVTYFIAKLALGDACSLISSTGNDSCLPADNENLTSGKLKNSERVGDQYFPKVVEDFICRAGKLESDLLRLDKRSSILDIRLETHELERFSMINRFAKFHGRGQADGAETSSSSSGAVGTTTPQKTCPQRYVVARPMPKNLPQGEQCLSL